jgi:hypothetical protein
MDANDQAAVVRENIGAIGQRAAAELIAPSRALPLALLGRRVGRPTERGRRGRHVPEREDLDGGISTVLLRRVRREVDARLPALTAAILIALLRNRSPTLRRPGSSSRLCRSSSRRSGRATTSASGTCCRSTRFSPSSARPCSRASGEPARPPRARRGRRLDSLPAGSAELARSTRTSSYFNPPRAVRAGARILSDSNIDWGLDLIRLAAELKRRGVSDPTVAYFGGDRVDYRVGVPSFQAVPVVRGRLVAISVFLRTAGPEFFAYHGATDLAEALRSLQRRIASGRDVGRIGYSIDLVELPAGENP